jgi:hypothetical protein
MRQPKKTKTIVYRLLQLNQEVFRSKKMVSYLFIDQVTQNPVRFEQKIYVRGKPWFTSISIRFNSFNRNPIDPAIFQINRSKFKKKNY